jgi:3-deoxy-D-manno-octulosonic acid kinase
MDERYQKTRGGAIIADADVDIVWQPGHFSPAFWEEQGRQLEPAPGGRGSVVFLRHGDDEWALRHYHRGGLAERFSPDRYVWSGEGRTRSFREWRLLAELHGQGLPVPRPVAAYYQKTRATYHADLITQRIAGTFPLSACLVRRALPDGGWRRIGACIRRFHDAGVCHADLNAHNILLDGDGRPWLLDFDKGTLRAPGPWRRRNLDRLLRSLRKISMADASTQFAPVNWEALLAGYGQTSA